MIFIRHVQRKRVFTVTAAARQKLETRDRKQAKETANMNVKDDSQSLKYISKTKEHRVERE